jgi:arylsulfatase A-like enzyme
MITADDAAPADLAYMPHTERLIARHGVTFTDAVAPSPICVPARASLLTGQYAHNHKAFTISGRGDARSFDPHRTLPIWLQAAGYDTLFIGKYLNGYGGPGSDPRTVEPGWTDWRATSEGTTYNFMHPILNINGRLRHYAQYNSTVFLRNSEAVLTARRRAHKPWYLWVNYVAPHQGGPLQSSDPRRLYPHRPRAWIPTTYPDPRDAGRFRDLHLPHNPNMFLTLANQPSDGRPMSPVKRQMVRVGYQQRIESLQAVDRAVADTVATLRCTHQLRNTVVIVASDNGFVTGQHNRYGKLRQFDDSLRIPMVMRGPGIPEGRTVRTAITNPDVATTIAAIAHAKPTRPQDGVNMLPWLSRGYRDRIIPIEAYPVYGGMHPIYTGIREGTWTYARWRFHGRRWEELYNRATDPYEVRNLARVPAYRAQLRWFRRLDARYRHCAGNSCPKQFTSPDRLPLLYRPGS